ncbi:unnamed protein product [Cyprideis torosa]|uniref:Uncharacterized protein n=1 Tax=Cyprideis torosa TaxID=163714 RepID=A0A7R8W8Q5_9CRUS|nr:unnamed protein product [Cyprideis torosa]CAG0887741.1 unnamed protein product [Cyprideis torosa]
MRLGIVSLVAFMAFAVWFLIDQTSASAFKRREVNGLQNIDDVYHKLGRPSRQTLEEGEVINLSGFLEPKHCRMRDVRPWQNILLEQAWSAVSTLRVEHQSKMAASMKDLGGALGGLGG